MPLLPSRQVTGASTSPGEGLDRDKVRRWLKVITANLMLAGLSIFTVGSPVGYRVPSRAGGCLAAHLGGILLVCAPGSSDCFFLQV